MQKTVLALAFSSVLALPACEGLTAQDRATVGGLTGAAVGIVTADALNADRNWIAVAALTGAAAGVLVAQNNATNQCAYARGDGTYVVQRCP